MVARIQIVGVERNKAMSDKKETVKRLRIIRGNEVFIGVTFSKKMPKDYTVINIVEERTVIGGLKNILWTACELLGRHGMLNERTLLTMCYWQYFNGFSNVMFDAAYGASNDYEMVFSHIPTIASAKRIITESDDIQRVA